MNTIVNESVHCLSLIMFLTDICKTFLKVSYYRLTNKEKKKKYTESVKNE